MIRPIVGSPSVLLASSTLAGRPRGHLRPVVRDGEQDWPALVIDGGIDGGVGAGLDEFHQTLGDQGVGENDLDLGGGLLRAHDVGDPLAADQVLDHGEGGLGRGEVCRVVDPQLVGPVLDPLGEGLPDRRPRTCGWVQMEPLSSQDAPDRGG